MPRAKATIRSIEDQPKNKLRSVDSFLTKSQPPSILLSQLEDLLDDQHKPFFARWLNQWKNRNQVMS